MQSCTIKMGTLLKLVCCVLVTCGVFLSAQGAVYSTADIAIKFSQCLIENLGLSPFFSMEDRNDMADVADVMARTMQNTRLGPRGLSTQKILLIGFVTSLADVIILENPRRNVVRKIIYGRTLEQCSISTTGYVDTEFINEALRIMSTLENYQVPMSEHSSAFQGGSETSSGLHPSPMLGSGYGHRVSESFDPSFVQPSSVQNPFVPKDFVTNEKTIFQVPESSHSFESSTGDSKSNKNFPLSGLAASNTGSSSIFLSSGHSEAVSTSSVVSDAGKYDGSAEISEVFFYPHPTITNLNEHQIPQFSEPSAIQPSPVKNPFIPKDFGTNDKTVFEVPESSFDFTSSSSESKSQLPVPQERNIDSFSSPITLKSSSNSGDVGASPMFSDAKNTPPLLENPQSPSATFEGLSIPQTKESVVFVIPPKEISLSEENTPLQDKSVPQTEDVPIKPPSDTINPLESSSDGDSSSPLSQTDVLNVPTNSSALESIITDIMINSPSFRNAFSLAMTQEDSLRLARTITEQSLSGYNSELIDEAMTAVLNAVATVTFSSPENYALALSKALASVLKLHDIPLFGDGASIASSMLTNFDNKQNFNQQISSTEEITEDLTAVDIPSLFEDQRPPLNFQSPVLAPEDIAGEIFSNTLSQYLAGSFRLANLFCGSNNVTNKIQTYFSLIKSSMSMYGTQISSIAATTISGGLMELPEESLCSGYPKVISDIISEILYENGLLQEANPEEISKQMEFSASFLHNTPIKAQLPEVASSEVGDLAQKDTIIESGEITPTISPSYSDEPGTSLDQPSAGYLSSSEVDALSIPSPSSDDRSLIQQQYEKYIAEASQDSVTGSSDFITMSPEGEQGSDYELPNYYTIPETTPISIGITEEVLSEASVLIDTLTSLSEAAPTYRSISEDETVNPDELAAYLLGEMESALAALNDKLGDQEHTMAPSDNVTETTAALNDKQTEGLEEVELTPMTTMHTKNNRQNRRRRKKHKTTSESDSGLIPATVSSLDQGSNKNDETGLPHQQTTKNSGQHPESFPVIEEKDVLSSNQKSSPILNVPSVDLQPSFQGPQFSDVSSSSKMLPPVTYNIEINDPSLSIAKSLSEIASSSIAFIRAQNFDINELCGKLNEFSAVVNIPPVDSCRELPVIDYLLHVLRSTTHILKGV